MMEETSPLPPLVYDLSFEELQTLMQTWKEPGFRAKQVWQGIYRDFWSTPAEFTNLPNKLRERLFSELRFQALTPSQILNSSDGETTKTLFTLPDGNAIEAVLMRYETRQTLCISTQSGCAIGCVFCATGQMGFHSNLTSGQIVEQVLYYARVLKNENLPVTNIVIMGMGEPFNNYANTLAAIDRLNDPNGMNFGARRFTISTVGMIERIRTFTKEDRQVNLAVSLHAANDDLRSSLVPVNRKYPLRELIQACREYVDTTHRRITFEWALIQDVNDSPAHAHELAGLVKGLLCHVNIIPLNPTRKYAGQATTRQRAEAFKAVLDQVGIPCTIRLRRGIDIHAGCGQLATEAKR